MTIVAYSIDMVDISSLNIYIPNLAFLQLLFIYILKIKIMFTTRSLICIFILQHSSSMVFVFHILHCLFLCQNLPHEFHLHYVPNILTFFFFLNIRFHVFITFELIHIDKHVVSFKLFNGH